LPTLRYAHGEPYLRSVIEGAGLSIAHLAAARVRTEKGAPVEGLIIVAQPSTAMRPIATSGG
jgi:predicted TPR repeat methyltransferase